MADDNSVISTINKQHISVAGAFYAEVYVYTGVVKDVLIVIKLKSNTLSTSNDMIYLDRAIFTAIRGISDKSPQDSVINILAIVVTTSKFHNSCEVAIRR